MRRQLAGFAAMVLGLGGCASTPQRAPAPSPTGSERLVVLDSTGRLAAYDVADLTVRWETALRADPPVSFGDYPRHALAVGADAVAYVVAPAEGTRPVLFAVDTGTGRQRFALPLPDGVEARVPVPDPTRHRVYLLASRPAGRDGRQAVIVVVDPGAPRVVETVPVSPADGRHWIPYAGTLSADARRLVISYHGDDTTGVDVLDAATLRRAPCAAPGAVPCTTQVHGRIRAYGYGLVAATGGEEMLLLSVDGRVTGRLDTQLAGNHLMEFDVDDARHRIYAIGPCGYTGGLAVIGGTTRLIRPPGGPIDERLCGDRVVVVDDGDAVAVTGDNKIRIVDVHNGKVLRATPSDRPAIEAVVVH